MRVMGALLVLVTLTMVACSEESQTDGKDVETSSKLYGIVVPQGPTQVIVFLGRRADVKQQLSEVLAGVKIADPWHMLLLPEAFLPAPDAESSFDLSKDLGIQITENAPFPGFSKRSGDPNWGSYSLSSGAQGLEGKLTITGAKVVADVKPGAVTPSGEFYGVAYSFDYRGPLAVSNGVKTYHGGISAVVGAFAGKTQ